MKILLIADPGIPVPPTGYGGIERIVYLLAREYTRQGHSVDLFAGPGSHFEEGRTFIYGTQVFPKKKTEGIKDVFRAWRFLVSHARNYDLIHNFGRLAYLLPLLNKPYAKIMSYQREITASNVMRSLSLPHKHLYFTGCSKDLIDRAGLEKQCMPVHNALDFSEYTLGSLVEPDAPFMFLGRIERIKGLHIAIKAVLAAGKRLWIGGNISSLPEEKRYYEQEILPHIDGERILYLGTLNDEQKNHYLRQSAAMLFPIEWDEPFGIVMIEAMACGTPVIGFRRGSVPEVVEEGLTGFITEDLSSMIAALPRVSQIDRAQCRERARLRFGISAIANQYLELATGQTGQSFSVSA